MAVRLGGLVCGATQRHMQLLTPSGKLLWLSGAPVATLRTPVRNAPRASFASVSAGSAQPPARPSSSVYDYSAEEGDRLFTTIWEEMRLARGSSRGGRMVFPREVLWLSGAPGAGKGTMAKAIMKERDIAHIFEVSSLLSSEAFTAMKNRGELIGDKEVIRAVLEALLDPMYKEGVIVDGFPRTVTQARAIVSLKDRLTKVRFEMGTTLPTPTMQIVVLWCSQEESVKRQLRRGADLVVSNMIVEETGVGSVVAARATDVDSEAALKRYRVFKEEVFDSLQTVQSQFPNGFHFINADVTPEQVRKQITKELHYKAATDLSPQAYALCHEVEPANRVIQQARAKLMTRLNAYATEYPALFAEAVRVLNTDFMPIVKRQALAGAAVVRSQSELLTNPIALNIVLDVLSERGFHVVLDVIHARVPVAVEEVGPTGVGGGRPIRTSTERTFVFRIEFVRPKIRSEID